MSDLEATAREALARAERATEGRWYVVGPPWGDGTWVIAGSDDPHVGRFVCDCENDLDLEVEEYERWIIADAEFIAHARTDVPELAEGVLTLLREVERLRAENEHIKSAAREGLLKWEEMVAVVPGHFEDAAKGFDDE